MNIQVVNGSARITNRGEIVPDFDKVTVKVSTLVGARSFRLHRERRGKKRYWYAKGRVSGKPRSLYIGRRIMVGKLAALAMSGSSLGEVTCQ